MYDTRRLRFLLKQKLMYEENVVPAVYGISTMGSAVSLVYA